MTKQGTHTTNHSRLASIEDLDAMLAQHSLVPAVIKLGGTTYQVRTDLTAAECQVFLDLTGAGYANEATTLLVGTDAERTALRKAYEKVKAGNETVKIPLGRQAAKLSAYLETLPRLHVALVSARIMRASKALAPHTKSEADLYKEYGHLLPADSETESAESSEPGESSAS